MYMYNYTNKQFHNTNDKQTQTKDGTRECADATPISFKMEYRSSSKISPR